MHFQGVFAYDNESIANLFKKYFSSVFSDSSVSESNDSLNNVSLNYLPSKVHVSPTKIQNSIKNMKSSFFPRTDGIPSAFIKNTSTELILPLHILFNKSITESKSHEIWKSSTITPIYKTGDRNCIEKYRPIKIINAVFSLLDDIISNRLYNHCSKDISTKQHGFVRGKSTTSNLLIHSHNIVTAICKRAQYDTVYTDFKKAFDLVNHKILINKLRNLDLPVYIIN